MMKSIGFFFHADYNTHDSMCEREYTPDVGMTGTDLYMGTSYISFKWNRETKAYCTSAFNTYTGIQYARDNGSFASDVDTRAKLRNAVKEVLTGIARKIPSNDERTIVNLIFRKADYEYILDCIQKDLHIGTRAQRKMTFDDLVAKLRFYGNDYTGYDSVSYKADNGRTYYGTRVQLRDKLTDELKSALYEYPNVTVGSKVHKYAPEICFSTVLLWDNKLSTVGIRRT